MDSPKKVKPNNVDGMDIPDLMNAYALPPNGKIF
jgi:hypothetical protein